MPTRHVEPQSGEGLSDVANALLRARKVVVVTGAGISTSSGIPDFRSENGLYSLIQSHFDAASRHARRAETAAAGVAAARVAAAGVAAASASASASASAPASASASKRRRLSRESSVELPGIGEGQAGEDATRSPAAVAETARLLLPEEEGTGRPVRQPCCTPQRRAASVLAAQPVTSPLSSAPATHLLVPPSTLPLPSRGPLAHAALALSSSPLSSPPPILFNPFIPSSPCAAAASRRHTTLSELDDATALPDYLGPSQLSGSGKSTIPNMKGKDLFDAAIWSDPIRTSVFYTFATSLRQKIRTAKPSGCHHFIGHLKDRGKLVRCYTQNIDQIEEKVGLSTSLQDGPGCRGRFSRRSTATAGQLGKMVGEASAGGADEPSGSDSSQASQADSINGAEASLTAGDPAGADPRKPPARPPKRDMPRSGVECVFLHGSLELLRCFLCGRVCSWDDEEREAETLAGLQPECPHCVGATAAREERGKRALGIGKLRPDIVLYGEEHPNSHLISPIVTHDLGLHPDMLLILGTSLRVHGLKVMVREFAKAVHSNKGKVVFVNLTKPPESSWGDVIDYWVQWDCDAWVTDLQDKIPKLWQDPEPPRPRKKRESGGEPKAKKEARTRQPAANPVALRDTKATGAYWTAKVLQELRRITGTPPPPPPPPPPPRRCSVAADGPPGELPRKKGQARAKRARKSAPGALEGPPAAPPGEPAERRRGGPAEGLAERPAEGPAAGCRRPPWTPSADHDRPAKQDDKLRGSEAAAISVTQSVKEKPRIGKRKTIDGEEVAGPQAPKSHGRSQGCEAAELKLPPLRSQQPASGWLFGRPQPLEPRSPPSGPLTSLSPNLRTARAWTGPHALSRGGAAARLADPAPGWSAGWSAGWRAGVAGTGGPGPSRAGLEEKLTDWGSSWRCER